MTDKHDRFITDIRSGCVAVRDTQHAGYDPDYSGLHDYMSDVVKYWHGTQEYVKCPTCGHERFDGWAIPDGCASEARELCRQLNAGEVTVEEIQP